MFKQKKLSLGARFGLYVASFLLGLLLFFSTIATALIADVQIVLSKDGISGIIREVLSAPAHVRPLAPVSSSEEGGLRVAPRIQRTYQVPRREEPSGATSNLTAGLTDQLIGMLYDQLGDQFQDVLPVTKEELTDMINESTVKDYIADKTASLITDYINDEITTTFEPEEIINLIEENAELIETVIGEPIPEDLGQQVADVFKEVEIIVEVEEKGLEALLQMGSGAKPENPEDPDASEGSDNDVLSNSGILPFNPREILNPIQQIAATQNLVIGISICLVLMAAIILINCHQLGKGLRRAGYPLMFAGSMVILNLLAQFQPDLWVVSGDVATGMPWLPMVLKLARRILMQTAVVNIVIFSTGFVLFVAGIVLSIVFRKHYKGIVSVPANAETEALAAAIVDETPVEVLPETAEEESPAPVNE